MDVELCRYWLATNALQYKYWPRKFQNTKISSKCGAMNHDWQLKFSQLTKVAFGSFKFSTKSSKEIF
jgi:hypothetical protein